MVGSEQQVVDMGLNTDRRTVDLSAFPDLVVIYLGVRVNTPKGLKTLLRFGPKIAKSVAEQPDGLLLHENMLFSMLPPHGGMRQYWQDFESLERWASSLPHKEWWAQFVRDTGGTGFWHELYFMGGYGWRDGGGLPRYDRPSPGLPELCTR